MLCLFLIQMWYGEVWLLKLVWQNNLSTEVITWKIQAQVFACGGLCDQSIRGNIFNTAFAKNKLLFLECHFDYFGLFHRIYAEGFFGFPYKVCQFWSFSTVFICPVWEWIKICQLGLVGHGTYRKFLWFS